MFTTCDSCCDHKEKRFECYAALRSLFILLLRSQPLVLEKKYSYNFPRRSLRHGHVKKKQNFISMLRPRRHDHEKNCLH